MKNYEPVIIGKASKSMAYIYHIRETFRLTKISPTPDTFVLQKYMVE